MCFGLKMLHCVIELPLNFFRKLELYFLRVAVCSFSKRRLSGIKIYWRAWSSAYRSQLLLTWFLECSSQQLLPSLILSNRYRCVTRSKFVSLCVWLRLILFFFHLLNIDASLYQILEQIVWLIWLIYIPIANISSELFISMSIYLNWLSCFNSWKHRFTSSFEFCLPCHLSVLRLITQRWRKHLRETGVVPSQWLWKDWCICNFG